MHREIITNEISQIDSQIDKLILQLSNRQYDELSRESILQRLARLQGDRLKASEPSIFMEIEDRLRA